MTTTLNPSTMQSAVEELTKPAMVQIVSTPPLKVAETDRVVSWSRRSTEKNPVTQEMRYRGVIVPMSTLKVPDDACTSKFQMLLQATVHDLADARFTDYIKERMHETEMPAALLNLDAVLAFWAEEKQRQTVDGAQVTEWLKQSATFKTLSEAQQKGWLTLLPKIAAPSYKQIIAKDQAAVIVSKLADDDLTHAVCVFVATRCNNILSAETAAVAL